MRLFSAIGPHHFESIVDQRVDGVGFEFEFLALLLHAREGQQILGEPRQPLCIVANDAEEAHVVVRIGQGAIDQRLGVPLDGGQRRAQFVRHVDHEIFADALQLFELGVLVLQLRHGLLQVFGGFVERLRELSELAANPFPAGGRGNCRAPVPRRAT